MSNVTVGKFAATLMNQIALHPELAKQELRVQIESGEEYKDIKGLETAYHCHFDEKTCRIDTMQAFLAITLQV